MDYEVIIIGAGVVGLALAHEFANNGRRTLVLEKNRTFGMETSSRNSEVIHAGIYYPSDTLKAKLCVPGNERLYEFCEKNSVPHRRIGKFIIAATNDEEEIIEQNYAQAKENGVSGICRYPMEKLRKEEPNVKAVAALWSPDTGIVDSHSLMSALFSLSKDKDCDYAFEHEVKAISKVSGGYRCELTGPGNEIFTVSSEILVNSAGLNSDLIAEMLGMDADAEDFRINYVRGHYFRISPSKSNLVSHLIYPAPLKNISGLGTHITVEMNGSLKLGPDVQYLNERVQDYSVPEERKTMFFESASLFLRGLQPDDLSPDQSGIRPKLQKEGGKFRDFIIRNEKDRGFDGFINLIGIESPGLTSCLEIAKLANIIQF